MLKIASGNGHEKTWIAIEGIESLILMASGSHF